VLNDILLFEEKYEEPLTVYQLEPVKDCYTKLTEGETQKLAIYFYTKCSTTYSVRKTEELFARFPATKEMLIDILELITPKLSEG